MNLMAAIATSTTVERPAPSFDPAPCLHVWLTPDSKGDRPGHAIIHTVTIVPGSGESERLSPDWFGAGC